MKHTALNADILLSFTSSLLLSRFDSPKPTPDFHPELWDLCTSGHNQIAVAAPRGHAKSTAVTHVVSLALVLFRIKDFGLIVSDTERQAIMFLQDIKKEFLENDALIELFGIKRIVKDAETDIIVAFNDGSEFRIMAFGSGQSLRGAKWRGKRPNFIIGDDLENDEIVMNEERRHKFKRWFYGALLPSGSDFCTYIIVGTILHLDALLEKFMPSLTHPKLKTTGVKSWVELEDKEETDTDYGWLSVRYAAHNEDFSEILWPEKFSRRRLEKIRKGYIAQGFPEGYAQEYLNRPVDDSLSYFRKEDLLPIPEEELNAYGDYYASGDLAISEKDLRAYTALVVARYTRDGYIDIVDVRRFRGDSKAIIDEIFEIQERYDPLLFGIEQENISRSIGPILYDEMGRGGKPYINLHLMPTGNKDKIRRARSIQARIRAGRVRFNHKASWWPALQEELMYFPRGSYMDQADALAWIGIMLDKMVDPKSEEDLMQEEYEEEFEESYSPVELGMNPVTGY